MRAELRHAGIDLSGLWTCQAQLSSQGALIDNLHEHGGESGLLQPGFGRAALHFHAGFGIDRDDQKDVRIEQILKAVRIEGLCGSFDLPDRIAR